MFSPESVRDSRTHVQHSDPILCPKKTEVLVSVNKCYSLLLTVRRAEARSLNSGDRIKIVNGHLPTLTLDPLGR